MSILRGLFWSFKDYLYSFLERVMWKLLLLLLNMQTFKKGLLEDMVSLVCGICCREIIPCPERGLRNAVSLKVGLSSSSRWLEELLGKKPEVFRTSIAIDTDTNYNGQI